MNDQPQQQTPAVVQQTTVIHVGNRKSVAGAVLLGFFFGPIGMIYSTVVGALVMFFVNVLVAIPTLGLGLFLTIPLGAVWAGIAAHTHNENLGGTQAVSASTTAATAAAAPAGWHPDPEGSGRLRYWDGARWSDRYASTNDAGSTSATNEDAPVALEAPPAEKPTAVLDEGEGGREGTAFCEACGQPVSAADKFCPACGVARESVG